jgi:hypothetical protein
MGIQLWGCDWLMLPVGSTTRPAAVILCIVRSSHKLHVGLFAALPAREASDAACSRLAAACASRLRVLCIGCRLCRSKVSKAVLIATSPPGIRHNWFRWHLEACLWLMSHLLLMLRCLVVTHLCSCLLLLLGWSRCEFSGPGISSCKAVKAAIVLIVPAVGGNGSGGMLLRWRAHKAIRPVRRHQPAGRVSEGCWAGRRRPLLLLLLLPNLLLCALALIQDNRRLFGCRLVCWHCGGCCFGVLEMHPVRVGIALHGWVADVLLLFRLWWRQLQGGIFQRLISKQLQGQGSTRLDASWAQGRLKAAWCNS